MGERKGQLKWYPPDFDPQKHKSLDAYHGTHPLRERAKKLDKGILIIRFEMPYDIWCGGCGIHIAQSVRYNAEKSKIGMYYTTPIWKFRMRCHLCPQYFEIKTDPANHDYVIMEGARRMEKRWDPKENEQIVPDDKDDIKKMKLDPMYNLEHAVEDKNKLQSKLPGLSEIERAQSKWQHDDLLNQQARNMFRAEKKALKAEEAADSALLKTSSLNISLVKEHEDDVKMAALMKYNSVKTFDEKQIEKRRDIESRPIFTHTPGKSSSTAAPTSAPSSSSSSSSSSSTTTSSLNSPLNLKDERLQKVALTKKKMGLKLASRKQQPFGVNSKNAGNSKHSTVMGIVKGKTAGVRKTDLVVKCKDSNTKTTDLNAVDATLRESELHKRLTGDERGDNESESLPAKEFSKSNEENSGEDTKRPGSMGLGCLMSSYNSSGSESSEDG